MTGFWAHQKSIWAEPRKTWMKPRFWYSIAFLSFDSRTSLLSCHCSFLKASWRLLFFKVQLKYVYIIGTIYKFESIRLTSFSQNVSVLGVAVGIRNNLAFCAPVGFHSISSFKTFLHLFLKLIFWCLIFRKLQPRSMRFASSWGTWKWHKSKAIHRKYLERDVFVDYSLVQHFIFHITSTI